ncbi:sigma-70 family RNA polymerase sigma factor [Myxococcota bacterium]|nr:sigma-70 family RNA polymerase sigma factor [Myxococcota bacterium]
MSIDDAELARLRAGDADLLRRVWLTERPIVSAICAGILGDGPDARDVADAVMLDFLFVRIHQLHEARSLGAYLQLMAARRALRLRDRLRRAVPTDLDDRADDAAQTPEQSAELRSALSALAGCLHHLTPKSQEAVRLRYYDDLTQEQIGALLGVSKQYVGRILSKSMETLRECLRAAGFEVSLAPISISSRRTHE